MAKGISAPRLVSIPHPLAGITPEEVRKKAESAVDTIVAVLVSPGSRENTNGY